MSSGINEQFQLDWKFWQQLPMEIGSAFSIHFNQIQVIKYSVHNSVAIFFLPVTASRSITGPY